jgi:hypothetical protein
MSKLNSHDLFGHFNHKLWPKEGPWVKLLVWFPNTKSQESPDSFAFGWRATYCWKSLDGVYNFASNLNSIRGLHTKLWAPKVAKVPTLGILGLPLGSLGTKCHLGASFVAKHKVYYKGEGGGFPQVWSMVSLVSSNLHVALPSTKSAQTMH